MYCFVNILNRCIKEVIAVEFDKGVEILNAIKNTRRILSTHQTLAYVRDALSDFETWSLHAKSGGEMLLRNQHAAERYCRGFLFEFRTYLDHMQTMLTREYGKGSKILIDFLNGTHNAYDNTPEYAFSYRLRNCSQHCENIVHKAVETVGKKGVRALSQPDLLLSSFNAWKPNEKTYIHSHTDAIDLMDIFEKTFNALAYVHTPVIQHMLNHNGVAADVRFLRALAEWLKENYSVNSGDIWNWHFAHAIHADAAEATVEEYNNHVVDIRFDVQVLDWESLHNLTDSLNI